MAAIKARISSYPEIDKVELEQYRDTAQPITLTGLKKGDEVFHIRYVGGSLVRGFILFTRDYKGKVTYRQYLTSMHGPIPQEKIDATWVVMKKIEADLILNFGLSGLTENLETVYRRCLNPERG